MVLQDTHLFTGTVMDNIRYGKLDATDEDCIKAAKLANADGFIRRLPDVPAGAVMVDGLGVGDVGSIVLRDRKHLAEDGLIIAVCTIEAGSGRVVSGPDIVSRGFVYVRESEALMDEARRLVNSTIEQCADENVREWSAIKLRVRDNLSRLLYNRTKRSPMILPIIMEV